MVKELIWIKMSHEGAAAAAAKRSKDEERAERSIYLFTLDSSFRKWYVAQDYSDLDKRLLGVFLIFGKWPLKFWGVIWPKDSLVLGWSGQKTPWCQGWVSTKESFVQITPTPRSLLARSPLKTLRAIFRKSKKHQGVFCPVHCRFNRCWIWSIPLGYSSRWASCHSWINNGRQAHFGSVPGSQKGVNSHRSIGTK